jgi:outer membrane protein assembly factor BamA
MPVRFIRAITVAFALLCGTVSAQDRTSSDPSGFVVSDIKIEGLQRIAEGTV